MSTVAERLAAFAHRLTYDVIPPDVIEKAKVTVLHNLVAALAGYETAAVARDVAKRYAPAPAGTGARLLLDGAEVQLEAAALANAALLHGRTQDDVHMGATTHIGCTTLPALLAVSDQAGLDGKSFLTAMVAGYEVVAAVGKGFTARSTPRGFRATPIYGPFGAAAACARALGASQAQLVSALGLAASFAGGTNQTWISGTTEWRFEVGVASRNGLLAALLARHGATGAPDAFEGAAGFYRSFVGDTEGVDQVGRRLGVEWEIHAVTFKPYPICGINQVPVHVLLGLVERMDIREDDVEQVTLTLNPFELAYPGIDNRGPFVDVGGTLMSARYCLAAAIRNRTVRLRDLSAFDDESLRRLIGRIALAPDPDLPALSCRVTIRTRSGHTHDAEYRSTPRTFNFDRHEVIDLCRSLMAEIRLPEASVDRLVARVLDLEHVASIRDLVSDCVPDVTRTA